MCCGGSIISVVVVQKRLNSSCGSVLDVNSSLPQKQQYVRAQIHASSRLMRKFPLGQDRFARQYWALPNLGSIIVEGVETSLYGDTQVPVEGSEVVAKERRMDTGHSGGPGVQKVSKHVPTHLQNGDPASPECSFAAVSPANSSERVEGEGDEPKEGVWGGSGANVSVQEGRKLLSPDVPPTDISRGQNDTSTTNTCGKQSSMGRKTCTWESDRQTGMEWNQSNLQHKLPFENTNFLAPGSDAERTTTTPEMDSNGRTSSISGVMDTSVAELEDSNTLADNEERSLPQSLTPTTASQTVDKCEEENCPEMNLPDCASSVDQESPHMITAPQSTEASPRYELDAANTQLPTGSQENAQMLSTQCDSPGAAPDNSKQHKWFSILPRQPCEATPTALAVVDSNPVAQVAASQHVSPTQQYVMTAPMAAAQYAYVTPSGQVIAQPMIQQVGVGYSLVGNALVPQAQYVAVNPSQQVQYVMAGQQGMSYIMGGQQYVTLGGNNQIVQVAQGEGGVVGVLSNEGVVNSEGVTVGAVLTSAEDATRVGDQAQNSGNQNTTTQSKEKDTEQSTSHPVVTQVGPPAAESCPTPVSSPAPVVVQDGGSGGGKLSESEPIQTVVNPAQVQPALQQEAEVGVHPVKILAIL